MYGTTFYEYKAAKLFEAARMTLGEVKVESDEIDEINRLKEKWNKKSTTRRTTTLVKPTEALELKEMCLQGPRRRCDLIYDGRTSANVYEVHRCPAGPTARAQLLLMSRYVAPPWQMVRALRARIHQGGDRELPNSWKDKLNNHEVELSRLIPFRHACSAMSTIYRNHAPLPQGFDAPLEVTVPLPWPSGPASWAIATLHGVAMTPTPKLRRFGYMLVADPGTMFWLFTHTIPCPRRRGRPGPMRTVRILLTVFMLEMMRIN